VPVDTGLREARNQFLAYPLYGLDLFALAYGARSSLPRGADARRPRALSTRHERVLQQVLVAVLVTACALYSAWPAAVARLRLRCLEALAALPGRARARLTAGRRACCRGRRRLRRLLAALYAGRTLQNQHLVHLALTMRSCSCARVARDHAPPEVHGWRYAGTR